MAKLSTLRRYGLFDAKVPRYTSYPPANRFAPEVGQGYQSLWLSRLSPDDPVSIYVHIPFCRRMCWFCACRTQGTKTLKPVESYLRHLAAEVTAVARRAPAGLRMARLHLGGGTPTLLSGGQMQRLLTCLHSAFSPTDDFEFSVEIDPTEASAEVLEELSHWQLKRASIGVQDFDPRVQDAIGRRQSLAQTESIINRLRADGVQSLNIDLLYGLPFQTAGTLTATLDKVVALKPDRLALYGYAHVPHMSKRQVMIPGEALPGAERRYQAALLACDRLQQFGYVPVGIDHFALPHDSLAQAAAKGRMRRNFQGYTDDPCTSLIGFGASSISQYQDGFVQNAVATAAYQHRVASDGLAGHKGYRLTQRDRLLRDMIEDVMCKGAISFEALKTKHPQHREALEESCADLATCFAEAVEIAQGQLVLRPDYGALARIIAAHLDHGLRKRDIHSMAI